ncbi:MAG: hypothetical protein RLY86_4355 [Pseudomonadota bacterium]|jgi:hypothetical protein
MVGRGSITARPSDGGPMASQLVLNGVHLCTPLENNINGLDGK